MRINSQLGSVHESSRGMKVAAAMISLAAGGDAGGAVGGE
jgi:hypothetical protein